MRAPFMRSSGNQSDAQQHERIFGRLIHVSGHEKVMSAARSRAPLATLVGFVVVLVFAAGAVAGATPATRTGAAPAAVLASPPSGVIQTVVGSGNGDGGAATAAPLSKPDAVAVDGAGNLYIAETGTNRIRLVSAATGQISTVAGSGTQGLAGDRGPATAAQLNQPDGVAVDTSGNVYIADTGNRVIRKVDPSGTITTLAGPSGLVTPRGLTYWNGNLFVADAAAGTIDQIRLPGGQVSTLSGGLPSQIQCPVATQNPAYLLPSAVAFDSTGDAYVADTFDNCVREVTDPFGSPNVRRVIGDGLPVSMGDGGMASAARVFQPRGVAVSTLATTVTTVTTQGAPEGLGAAAPPTITHDVTRQTRDVVFVADTMGHKVRMIDPASGSPPLVTSLNIPGLNRPYQMTSGPDGSLYVADNAGSRVYKITPQTQETVTNRNSADPATTIQVTTDTPTFSGAAATVVAGNGTSAFGGDGGLATQATISTPLGMATDTAGNVYFADSANQRVRKISTLGVISTVAGNGFTTGDNMPGRLQASDTFGMGDGGAATNATFNRPSSVAVDKAGNVFIADTYNNAIREVTAADGKIRTVVGASGSGAMLTYSLNDPYAVALDAAGNLYIADTFNHKVLEAAAGFTKRPVLVAGGGSGFTEGSNATQHALGPVAGVAVDVSGTLYISDAGYNRIWAVSGGKIRTLAGSATGGGFGGDGGPATKALLKGPGAIAVDATGNVFVADTANNRVRKVATNGTITTIAGTGTQGFRGDGATATAARLALPFAVTVVGGDLWIADTSNNRIRAIGGPASESPTADFVKAAYHDFLGQAPSPATLEDTTRLLDAGASRYDFVLALAKQPAWASTLVKQFYVNTLGRAGDPGGIAYWTNVITSGNSTVAQVASQFYSSDEYYGRVHATATNPTPWVQSLYTAILNRPGSASDVAYWSAQTKSRGRGWVAYFFYQSPESAVNRVWNLYCAGSVGAGVYRRCFPATGSYAPVLDRAPDAGGLSYWPSQILSRGDLALAASLASGAEYFANAQHRGF